MFGPGRFFSEALPASNLVPVTSQAASGDSNQLLSGLPAIKGSLLDYARETLKETIGSYVSNHKILYVDAETSGILSVTLSFSQLLLYNFLDVDNLETLPDAGAESKSTSSLQAVIFVRPTEANVNRICSVLQRPYFTEHVLIFTNSVSDEDLGKLARSDAEKKTVARITEMHLDYHIIRPHIFSLELPSTLRLMANERACWQPFDDAVFHRMVDGLAALVCTAAKSAAESSVVGSRQTVPTIRVSTSSPIATVLGLNLLSKLRGSWLELLRDMKNDKPASLERNQSAIVLILDRRDDMHTPFVTPWTYHAMLHEHLNCGQGKVKATEDAEPMSLLDDAFLMKYGDYVFGDVLTAVKHAAEEQQQTGGQNLQLDRLKQLLDAYPQQKRASALLSKHLELVHSLAQLVDRKGLYDVSNMEAQILSGRIGTVPQETKNQMLTILQRPDIPVYEKYRLILLHQLRFGQTPEFLEGLRAFGVDEEKVLLIPQMEDFVKKITPARELLNQRRLLSLARDVITRTMTGRSQTIYEHRSLVGALLDPLSRGKLDPSVFGEITENGVQNGQESTEKIQWVVIFVVGGVTMGEATEVEEWQNNSNSMMVYLGGTAVQNSRGLLADTAQLSNRDEFV